MPHGRSHYKPCILPVMQASLHTRHIRTSKKSGRAGQR